MSTTPLTDAQMDAITPLTENPEPLADGLPNRPLVRVEHGDRNQCVSVHANLQCPYRAIGTRREDGTWDGVPHCPRHGYAAVIKERKAETRMYNLAKWQNRMEQKADNPRLKSIREEIAILKMTLENKFAQLKTEADLDMRAGGVIELIRTIAKTIETAHKIEKDTGNLIDKTQALMLVASLVEIISTHIASQETLKSISEDMLKILPKFFPD